MKIQLDSNKIHTHTREANDDDNKRKPRRTDQVSFDLVAFVAF